MAIDGVEVDAGRGRDAGVLEQAEAEGGAVIGEGGNVRIEIERAVGRNDLVDAGLTVTQALNPAKLPLPLVEYLAPRGRVDYYLEAVA